MMEKKRSRCNLTQYVSKPLYIFHIILIFAAVIGAIFIFIDPQHPLVYMEIVLFIGFLFFLTKGISHIKHNDYKSGIAFLVYVIIYIVLEVVKILLYSGFI